MTSKHLPLGALAELRTADSHRAVLDAFFDLSQEILGVLDSEGCFLKVNSAWTYWLGHAADALLGRSFLRLVAEESQGLAKKWLESLVHSRESLRAELVCETGHGDLQRLAWYGRASTGGGEIVVLVQDETHGTGFPGRPAHIDGLTPAPRSDRLHGETAQCPRALPAEALAPAPTQL